MTYLTYLASKEQISFKLSIDHIVDEPCVKRCLSVLKIHAHVRKISCSPRVFVFQCGGVWELCIYFTLYWQSHSQALSTHKPKLVGMRLVLMYTSSESPDNTLSTLSKSTECPFTAKMVSPAQRVEPEITSNLMHTTALMRKRVW